jgi:hypothetical protein
MIHGNIRKHTSDRGRLQRTDERLPQDLAGHRDRVRGFECDFIIGFPTWTLRGPTRSDVCF